MWISRTSVSQMGKYLVKGVVYLGSWVFSIKQRLRNQGSVLIISCSYISQVRLIVFDRKRHPRIASFYPIEIFCGVRLVHYLSSYSTCLIKSTSAPRLADGTGQGHLHFGMSVQFINLSSFTHERIQQLLMFGKTVDKGFTGDAFGKMYQNFLDRTSVTTKKKTHLARRTMPTILEDMG